MKLISTQRSDPVLLRPLEHLGRQPTPQTVRDAETNANELAQAALKRVKKADAAGNAAACTEALIALKEWYGVE
jgi:hypothetical protein